MKTKEAGGVRPSALGTGTHIDRDYDGPDGGGRLYSPQEAADFLGVCRRKVRQMARKAKVKPLRLGYRTIRYRRADLFKMAGV